MYPNPVSGEDGRTPNVTSRPFPAASSPAATASRKRPACSIQPSDGTTRSVGSSPRESARHAASATAGAVSRGVLSSMMALNDCPISRHCSAARKRCSSLQTMQGSSAPSSGARRSSVSWSIERLPARERNCLGRSSRDKGHRRVPMPPASTTGRMAVTKDLLGRPGSCCLDPGRCCHAVETAASGRRERRAADGAIFW